MLKIQLLRIPKKKRLSQFIIKRRKSYKNKKEMMSNLQNKDIKCKHLQLITSKSMSKKLNRNLNQRKTLKTSRNHNNQREMNVTRIRLFQQQWNQMMMVKIKMKLKLQRFNTRRRRPLCCNKINHWIHTLLTLSVTLVTQSPKLQNNQRQIQTPKLRNLMRTKLHQNLILKRNQLSFRKLRIRMMPRMRLPMRPQMRIQKIKNLKH